MCANDANVRDVSPVFANVEKRFVFLVVVFPASTATFCYFNFAMGIAEISGGKRISCFIEFLIKQKMNYRLADNLVNRIIATSSISNVNV